MNEHFFFSEVTGNHSEDTARLTMLKDLPLMPIPERGIFTPYHVKPEPGFH